MEVRICLLKFGYVNLGWLRICSCMWISVLWFFVEAFGCLVMIFRQFSALNYAWLVQN